MAVSPGLQNATQFEALVREHQAQVFRTLVRLTGSREHVEDLAQEVFLRLFGALPRFRGEALLTTYLYRITLNVAQDEWKRRRRQDQPLRSLSDEKAGWSDRLQHPGAGPEQQLTLSEFEARLEEELGRLSDLERAVLVLYHQEELSYGAIAVALGLPVGTVRTHLHRARKRLRERMAEHTAGKEARCRIATT